MARKGIILRVHPSFYDLVNQIHKQMNQQINDELLKIKKYARIQVKKTDVTKVIAEEYIQQKRRA